MNKNISPTLHHHHSEQIVVVARTTLLADNEWQGLLTHNFDHYLERILVHHEFHPRFLMEADPTYKQIIPYVVFCHANKFFLMQRAAKASESRLHSKYTLGIGGHMRKEDMQNADLLSWAIREFHEEVTYHGSLKITPLGLLNDDSNPVGQVHLGVVLLAQGDSSTIAIKSELAQGWLASYDECFGYIDRMESWSQLIMPALHRTISL